MATTRTTSGDSRVLSSEWGELNPRLLARFFEVQKKDSEDKKTVMWERVPDSIEVRAPLSVGSVEVAMNWQSPFENVGPDQKFSTLSAMLQTGSFTHIMQQAQAQFPGTDVFDGAVQGFRAPEGRSNMTKLNSTQVFNGAPPLKINITAHFRAYKDAKAEVRDPLNQLMAWTLPKKIAPDGMLAAAVRGELSVFPSEVPQILAMQYGDILFMPVVIEALPYPLVGPRDPDGILTTAEVALQVSTLSAIDRQDWEKGLNPSIWN